MSEAIDRNVITSFSFPQDVFEDMQSYCKKNGMSQSELVKHLVRKELYQDKSLAKKK